MFTAMFLFYVFIKLEVREINRGGQNYLLFFDNSYRFQIVADATTEYRISINNWTTFPLDVDGVWMGSHAGTRHLTHWIHEIVQDWTNCMSDRLLNRRKDWVRSRLSSATNECIQELDRFRWCSERLCRQDSGVEDKSEEVTRTVGLCLYSENCRFGSKEYFRFGLPSDSIQVGKIFIVNEPFDHSFDSVDSPFPRSIEYCCWRKIERVADGIGFTWSEFQQSSGNSEFNTF